MGTYVGNVSGIQPDIAGLLDNYSGKLSSMADQAFSAAAGIAGAGINSTSNIILPKTDAPKVPNIAITLPIAPGVPFVGEVPTSNLTAPTFTTPSYFAGQAPTFDTAAPTLAFLDRPTVTLPAAPGASPIVHDVTLPVSPNIVLPLVPTLREINLPDTPAIIQHTFTGVSPAGDVPVLTEPNFVWSEQPYSPRLTTLSTKLAELLTFDYKAEETAIYERGQERIDRETNEAVLDLTNDFASRGFALPTGAMLSAIREARMKGAEAGYDLAREAMIKAAEVSRDRLALAIQSGVQYEGQWMTYQTQYAQRAFEAARLMTDIAFRILDARVALFNARLTAYQTEAQVYRDLIQGELLKIETYRTQLEGQRIVAELNTQDIELYRARIQGALSVIELYRTQVLATNALVDVDRSKIQAFGEQVQAYRAQIDAGTAQYTAWGQTIQAEATKAQVYDIEARAFASRVDAYRGQETTKIEGARLQIETDRLQIEGFASQVQALDVNLRAYVANADTKIRLFGGQTQLYTAQAGVEEAKARVQIGAVEAQIQAYTAQVNAQIEVARVSVSELQVQLQTIVSRLDSAGRVYGQLAASSLSAFNFGATASTTFSESLTNSLSEEHPFSAI